MKISSIAAVVACATATGLAIELAPRSVNPKVVGLDLERGQAKRRFDFGRSVLRKRGTVTETLDNQETLYFANLTLGTPAQSLRLHIDTGSSDLWVNVPNSTECTRGRQSSCLGGTFSPDSSSSLKVVNNDFNISYVDGSGASGNYVSDTLVFGSVSLSNFQFGLGDVSSSLEGVLGIGYMSNEVQVQRAGGAQYPNLPQALVNGGLISRNAYSLWLNDLDASTGMILFGGVNTAKYKGELATLPIIAIAGGYYELAVALTGVGTSGSSASSTGLPSLAVLDSGTTLTYLPNDIASSVFNKVGATYDSNAGAAYAACSLASSTGTVDFTFSGVTISVGYDELLIPTYASDGSPLKFANGQTACIFGIAPSGGTTSVLGDTFLRSAYVVYDLTNNQISIAQTVFNSTANDVREISSGSGLVPGANLISTAVSTAVGATGAANAVTATATNTLKSAASAMVSPVHKSHFIVPSIVTAAILLSAGILSF